MVWRLPISMGMIYVSLFCLPRLPGTYYMLWHIEVSTTDYYTKWSKRKTNIWYHLNVESKNITQANLQISCDIIYMWNLKILYKWTSFVLRHRK